MINYSTSIILAVIILIVAVPYVSWVRNRAQKPVAAYFIFVIAFVTSGLVLFGVLTWLVWRTGLDAALNRPVPAVIFLILVFVPAIAIGTALVRKPPSQAGEPD
jgi:uncharacterized membrane protein